jgi:Sec-independent protein secretion pathway component TatC
MELIPLPFEERVSLDGEKKAKMVKQLLEGVRLQIEKKNKLYASKANKGRKLIVFQPGNWVWLHMRIKLTFQVSMVLVLPLMLLILHCLTQILIRG